MTNSIPLTKVLYVIDAYKNPWAGTEGQIKKLIENLPNNYHAELLVFRHSEFTENPNVDFPCQIHALSIQKLASVNALYSLFKFFRLKQKEGFKIAHIFFNDPSIICPPILKILGYKVIISRRDMGYWYTPKIKAILKLIHFFVDKVIVNSQAVRQITVEAENYNLDDVIVIYNSVDASPYEENIKQETSLDTDNKKAVKVVLVANIRPIKRIDDAITAIDKLNKKGINICLTIIGAGDPGSLDFVKKNGCPEYIRFMGSRSDVTHLLPQFDIGLLCSESEGFSNTLMEYCLAGKPVICSEVGGNPEIITHSINGYLYPVGDIDTLCSYLEKLALNHELRRQLGTNAKSKIFKTFSTEKSIKQHTDCYSGLLGS